MERKLGTAFYNLGQFDQAGIHFRTALELMGIIIPELGQKYKLLLL